MGKLHFWLMFIGFNLTFGPMHWLGLQGMVRRTWRYPPDYWFTFWNQVVTAGAFIIALAILIFMINLDRPSAGGRVAGHGPVGRSHPGVVDPLTDRPNTTSAWCRWSTPSTTSGTEVRRRTPTGRPVRQEDADEHPGPARARSGHQATGADPPARARPTSRWSWRPGLPLIAYGIIYHLQPCGNAADRHRGLIALAGALSAGRWSRPKRRSRTTPSRWRSQLTDVAHDDDRRALAASRRGTAPREHEGDRSREPQAGDVGRSFLGVPLLRGAHHQLHALRGQARVPRGPTPLEIYDIPFTSVSSFVLLMSSLTMVLGPQRPGTRATRGHPDLAARPPPCSARSSSAGSSSSSASSSLEGMTLTTNPAASASTCSPGSTGSTSHSA